MGKQFRLLACNGDKKMIIKTYSHKRKIICFIEKERNRFFVTITGASEYAGHILMFETLTDAEKVAKRYFWKNKNRKQ